MKDLIEKLKKKDESALREVMGMYKNQIYNYLNLMLGNSELAEDLTQDTFVKVYFKASTLRTDNLKAWIYTIATNLARSHFRRQKVKHWLSLTDLGEKHVSYNQPFGNDIMVEEILSLIPDKYKIPLVMKEAQNFTYEEIAEILGKPAGTIKSLVFRGREQIKCKLNFSQGGQHG